MRLIILYSEQLPEDSMRECDEEVRARLNELSHYVFELKKKEERENASVLPKGRTQKRILKNPKKRVEIPQKYIKTRVLQGVNQNPHKRKSQNGRKKEAVIEYDS